MWTNDGGLKQLVLLWIMVMNIKKEEIIVMIIIEWTFMKTNTITMRHKMAGLTEIATECHFVVVEVYEVTIIYSSAILMK